MLEAYYHYDTHIAPLPRDEKGNIIARDNSVDAFRHAYTLAMLTQELSQYIGIDLASAVTLTLGLANEVPVDQRSSKSHNMDLWNNAVGSNLVRFSLNEQELLKSLEQSFHSGDMILSLDDNRVFGKDFKDLSIFDLSRPDMGDVPCEPFVLDLNGDGVKLTGATDGTAYFDLDADGIREKVGWVSAEDGLLVRDLNGNGKIDNINELIGDQTTDSYTILRDFDQNNDGKITSADNIWGSLKVWQDANSNGVMDAGELKSLAHHKITKYAKNDNTLWVLNNQAA